MADMIGILDAKVRSKSASKLDGDIMQAFPTQKIFSEKVEVDLSHVTTANGKYTIDQLMTTIRNTCRNLNADRYYTKDAEDFVKKVEKLPDGEKI